MKAILQWGVGLVSLLLLVNLTHGYVWVSPALKVPLPVAPSPSNSGFYLMDAYGRPTGPHYYLVPPGRPFNGILPGKTGDAIMSGYLPHTLLLSKEGVAIGNVPLVGQKKGKETGPPPSPMPGAGLPQVGMAHPGGPGMPPPGNMQPPPYGRGPMPYPGQPMPYGGMPGPMPYPGQPMAYGGIPGPMPYPGQPMAYGGMPPGMPQGNMQVPHGAMPMPYPMPYGGMPPGMPPGNMQVPYGGMPMPYPGQPMPYGGMPAPMPYPGQPMPMMPNRPIAWQYPGSNIWLAQNLTPAQGPMMPIPPFSPSMPVGPTMPGMPTMPMMPGMPVAPMMPMMPMMPGMPVAPMMPGMPTAPGVGMGPMDGFQAFGPMQPISPFNRMQPINQFNQFTPMQGPMPPRMDMAPMQLPRMEMMPPPQQKTGGAAFPMHPFTRSPRDFFMWGETMEDEQKLRTRPFPVPR